MTEQKLMQVTDDESNKRKPQTNKYDTDHSTWLKLLFLASLDLAQGMGPAS